MITCHLAWMYVWVPDCDPGTITAFVEHYVDKADPGDDRLSALIRTYIDGTPDDADRAALDDARRDGTDKGFSLYLSARSHYGSIITVTGERSLVLGLSIDDPDGSDLVLAQARALLDSLRAEFGAPAGRAGVELAPAHSRQEWEDDATVLLRVGTLPA